MNGINLKTMNPADRVALRGVRMHAVLAAMSQKTVVEQTFLNREQHAIEAVYTFPLPDGAAVCAFEAITADRVLTGVIEETDDAIEKYESAVAAGDAAYLAEQERPDVFTIRVGNIKPRQAATVRLTYICPLEVNDNQIRVSFPTTVAPRYAADAGMDPVDAAIDADALNPPHVLSVPYGLTFSADVRLGRKVKAITSPTHAIQITGDDREGYHLTLGGVVAMDREVVLSIELIKEVGPCVQFEGGKDNQSYIAVTFVPEFEAHPENPAAIETVFVLDCSGSMGGSSITQATAALELCLRSLNVGDTFNICKFGSSFELMSPEPLVYSQATLDQAIGYIATGNNFGGTELLQPLQAVLRTTPAAGAVRSVILLTDGQVSNEPAILKLARQHRGRNRIFSFGIGPACSSFLVKGLARVTGGAAEFIVEGENMHEKVLRTFARLASPLASDVRIDWCGAEAQTLAELPPVFDGEVLTVFARVLGRRPAEVVLKCRTDAGEQSWAVAVPNIPLPDGGIATMWARRTIQSLEEVNGITRSAAPGKGSRERDLLISLSKEFGLLSSLTTFVAVEHRSLEERNQGQPATRRVPVMLANGWGGVAVMGMPAAGAIVMRKDRGVRAMSRGRSGPAGAPVSGPPPVVGPILSAIDDSGLLDLTRESDTDSCDGDVLDEIAPGAKDVTSKLTSAASGTPPAAPRRPRLLRRLLGKSAGRLVPDQNRTPGDAISGDDLSQILLRQTAAGDFRWDERLDQIASTVSSWNDMSAKADARVPAGTADRDSVISTLRALLLLQTKFAADESIWKRAAEKAMRYVALATGQPAAAILAELKSLLPL